MATNPEEQHEKEGICMADVVKALVLAWSAALLTASYLGIFPQMKMDNLDRDWETRSIQCF